MSNKITKTDKLPAAQVNVNLIEQYVKGLTLKTGYSKYALSKLKGKLSTDFVVAPVVKKLEEEDDVYEVTLNINGVAKLDGIEDGSSANSNEIYRVQLEYAGLFKLIGEASEEAKEEIGHVVCTSLMFPFARREVADAITGSGYQPILLDPINFQQIFLQHKERQAQQLSETVH